MKNKNFPIFASLAMIGGLITLGLVSKFNHDNEPTPVVTARMEHGANGLKEEGYTDIKMGPKIDGASRCGNFKHAVRYSATLPDGTSDTGVYCTND